MTIKAIFFDLFETLVENTPSDWHVSFEAICKDQNLSIEPSVLLENWYEYEHGFRAWRLDRETMEMRQPFYTYREAWNWSFERVFEDLNLNANSSDAVNQCLRDLGRRPIFPETINVLASLQGNYLVGLLSNADRDYMEPILKRYDIFRYFDSVVCSEDAKAYKPHQDIFQFLLNSLGLDAENVIHVGDRQEEDVWGANRLGIRTVLIDRDRYIPNPLLPDPDIKIGSLSDLLELPEIKTQLS